MINSHFKSLQQFDKNFILKDRSSSSNSSDSSEDLNIDIFENKNLSLPDLLHISSIKASSLDKVLKAQLIEQIVNEKSQHVNE